MKKGFHILFAFVFLALSVGIMVNKHYSAGELFSVALFGEPESCCEMPCDCCDDESELYKLSGDYIFSYQISEVADPEVLNLIVKGEDFTSPTTILDGYPATEFRKDIHPPREINDFLSEVQSYLL
jgi:hypothetical protein